ncbi:MAG: hypothetical protein ACE5J3_00275 [Methanosarcinales archaeon]
MVNLLKNIFRRNKSEKTVQDSLREKILIIYVGTSACIMGAYFQDFCRKFCRCVLHSIAIASDSDDFKYIASNLDTILKLIANGGVGRQYDIGYDRTHNRRHEIREILQDLTTTEVWDLKLAIVFAYSGGGTGSGATVKLLELLAERNIPTLLMLKIPRYNPSQHYYSPQVGIHNTIRMLERIDELYKKNPEWKFNVNFTSDVSKPTRFEVDEDMAYNASTFMLIPLVPGQDLINVSNAILNRSFAYKSTIVHCSVKLSTIQETINALEDQLYNSFNMLSSLEGIEYSIKDVACYGPIIGPEDVVEQSRIVIENAVRTSIARKYGNIEDLDLELWPSYIEDYDSLELSLLLKGVDIQYPEIIWRE